MASPQWVVVHQPTISRETGMKKELKNASVLVVVFHFHFREQNTEVTLCFRTFHFVSFNYLFIVVIIWKFISKINNRKYQNGGSPSNKTILAKNEKKNKHTQKNTKNGISPQIIQLSI